METFVAIASISLAILALLSIVISLMLIGILKKIKGATEHTLLAIRFITRRFF